MIDSSWTTQKSRIVGIDLTGSERRKSGWCLLTGPAASTRLLSTDDEIVEATVAASPAVVAIDSPLSLPRGRVSVFDDDPGRAEFGITRACERELCRRGTHVYPTLIPSLQRLTERGIRLAARLSEHGLASIEVYPGGAQDVLGIGRKRAGLAQLAEGLADLGISGNFQSVSHDELDAITAAVVGAFYVAGQFEALGDVDEGLLIMPKWNVLGVAGGKKQHDA
jgi:predicted nuclease with RNAse H fold